MRALLPTLLLAVLLSGCASMTGTEPVTIALNPEHHSGESGTATLIPEGDKTKVVIALSNTPAGVAQPVHIHPGTCDHLNPHPRWGLADIVDGKSDTIVPVSLAALEGGTYAINVHKSAQDMSTYVACGDIPEYGGYIGGGYAGSGYYSLPSQY